MAQGGDQKCNIATQGSVFLLQGDTFSMEREQDMLRCFFFEVRELLNLREKGQKLLQMLYKHMLHHVCLVYSNDAEAEI